MSALQRSLKPHFEVVSAAEGGAAIPVGLCLLETANPRAGMALGMVMQLPEEADETSVSRTQLLAKLDVCMGGRVAEELIFGDKDVTTGASSDLEQVRIVWYPIWCQHRMRDLILGSISSQIQGM